MLQNVVEYNAMAFDPNFKNIFLLVPVKFMSILETGLSHFWIVSIVIPRQKLALSIGPY
jgi:hypothetical protein